MVSSEEILTAIWGVDYTEETEVVERIIASLGAKLHNGRKEPRFIAVYPGVGYRFRPAAEQLVSLS